jgi:hypothetical protein
VFTTTASGQHRILDFDIENRPLSYIGSDFTSADVTAIAWSWVGEDKVTAKMLTLDPESADEMLWAFRDVYDQAEIVTGHYVTRHDLPILNGAMLEFGLPPLDAKLASDTKCHLVKRLELPASQEALAGMYGVDESKKHMTQTEWRAANRLEPWGVECARKRVINDVIQHKALRAALIEAGALHPPKLWRP